MASGVKVPNTEFNLKDELYHGKCMVPTTRNQHKEGTCFIHTTCTFVQSQNIRQGALQNPPEDFEVLLADEPLFEQFKKEHKDGKHSGFTRLVKTLQIAERDGIIGTKGEGPFKIRSFEEHEYIHYAKPSRCRKVRDPPPKIPQGVQKLLRRGHVMAGTFNISKNYKKLEPDEIYVYDSLDPERTENGRTCSHAVSIIGYGCRGGVWYYLFQNSYGERWGQKGIGKVAMSSLTHLVQLKV